MGNTNETESLFDKTGTGGPITELNQKPPAIASFNGSLYVAFKDATGLIYVGVSNDGVTWKYVRHIGQPTSDSPNMTVHGDHLYIAYRNGGSGIFVVRTNDGQNFIDTRSVGHPDKP